MSTEGAAMFTHGRGGIHWAPWVSISGENLFYEYRRLIGRPYIALTRMHSAGQHLYSTQEAGSDHMCLVYIPTNHRKKRKWSIKVVTLNLSHNNAALFLKDNLAL